MKQKNEKEYLGSSYENLLTGKGTIRAGQDFLTNFEVQMYYQNEPNLMVFIQEMIYLE